MCELLWKGYRVKIPMTSCFTEKAASDKTETAGNGYKKEFKKCSLNFVS